MQCDRMHAIIRVSECLANQGKKGAYGGHHYLGCKGCETGALAMAGGLNDDDVEVRLAALRAEREAKGVEMRTTMNRTEVAAKTTPAEAESGAQAAPKPAATERPAEKKQCRNCKEWKSLSEFAADQRAKDGRQRYCKSCKAVVQKKWMDKKNARLRAAAAIIALRDAPAGIVADDTPEHVLVLDFSEHMETLEKLKELAKGELRTPSAQLLYWLIRGKIAG